MPRKSQRKGRRGELEVAALFRAAGFDAAPLGIYEPLDVRVNIDNCDHRLEVKLKKNCLAEYYKAIKAGAWGKVERADYGDWAITIPLRTFFDLFRFLEKDSPDDKRSRDKLQQAIGAIRDILEGLPKEGLQGIVSGEMGEDNQRGIKDEDARPRQWDLCGD
jgi:hypothetical protein